VISSPLLRARQTAEIIAEALHSPLELDPLWMERDNGSLRGMPLAEVDERLYPRSAQHNPYQPTGETGESQFDLYLRGGGALQRLLRHPPGRYLVVAHGGILNMVLYAILGIAPTPMNQGPRFRFQNTAFASLTYNPDEHLWRLLRLNDRSHWPGGSE